MLSESLTIKGHISAKLYESDGTLVQKIEQPNLVTKAGKNYFARRILDNNIPRIRQIAIGRGTTPASLEDTSLVDQTAIVNFTNTSVEQNNTIYLFTGFPEGTGLGDIWEVGLFTEPSSGSSLFDPEDLNLLLCRSVFNAPFNKTSTQYLNVIWRLQIA